LTIIVVNLVAKFYAVAKISQIYCWGILIWATLYKLTTRLCTDAGGGILLQRRVSNSSISLSTLVGWPRWSLKLLCGQSPSCTWRKLWLWDHHSNVFSLYYSVCSLQRYYVI